ncbi:MAG: hypothetical protein ACI9UT_003477 [Flavobacteriales bacterium]|jgi:hypothetical protein
MNNAHNNKSGMLRISTLGSTILLASTNRLAEVTHVETINTQDVYPYKGLVDRSEEVIIIYTLGNSNVSCREQMPQMVKLGGVKSVVPA